VRSKAERGYALSTGDQPVAATSIALAPAATTAEAFTAIGLSCLHHLAANEGAVRRGDSEGVHQMRVGLRRLRAAISIFKDMLQNSETEDIKTQLRWLSKELGPARDFDVLVEEGVAPLRRATRNKPEMTLLEADLKQRRDEGFKRAKAAVETRRYQRIVLDTALWLIDGEWLGGTRASSVTQRDRPADAFAWDVMQKRTRKIVKKSRKIETLDARRRHKLRIAAKKLRYAAGFFVSVLGNATKPRKRFEKELKSLQSTLGKLNDIAVHQRVARQYARANSRSGKRPQKAFAAGVLTGREQASTRACLAAAAKAGRGLAKAERHWL
jgi:triphosphatase